MISIKAIKSHAGGFVAGKGVTKMETRMMTSEEVAQKHEVKVKTVWKWIREKKLRAVRLAKGYRITADALAEFEQKLREERRRMK